jgi:hypothetical protein
LANPISQLTSIFDQLHFARGRRTPLINTERQAWRGRRERKRGKKKKEKDKKKGGNKDKGTREGE